MNVVRATSAPRTFDARLLDETVRIFWPRTPTSELLVAIAVGDDVVFARCYGAASSIRDPARAMFRIGSITKSLTGAMISHLAMEKYLDLDSPLTAYDPMLKLRRPGRASTLTLRHLLSHCSGLPNGPAEYAATSSDDSLDFLASKEIPRYPVVGPPGLSPSYSNLGVCLAAYVAERVTGRPYEDLMRDFVFEPWGMESTTFATPSAGGPPWNGRRPSLFPRPIDDDLWSVRNRRYEPGAYAFSCVRDLTRFARSFHGEPRSELDRHLVNEMRPAHSDWLVADDLHYGLCLYEERRRGWEIIGHDGRFLSTGSKLAVVPSHDVAVVISYSNAQAAEHVRERVLDAVLRGLSIMNDEPARPAESQGFHLPEPYLGIYCGPGMDLLELLSLGTESKILVRTVSYQTIVHRIRDRVYESTVFNNAWHPVPFTLKRTLSIGLVARNESGISIMVNGRPYRREPA